MLANAAIQNLSFHADDVKTSFSHFLRAAVFDGISSNGCGIGQLGHFDDFQFLEAEQIDANIESALSQQEVELAVCDALPALDALISNLMGWVTVQPRLNPIRPESFVYALREPLKIHVSDQAARSGV